MRHAFGSNAADAGCGIDVVADLLGHASVSSSQVYLHPDPGRLRAAVDLVPSPREQACRGDPVTGAAAAGCDRRATQRPSTRSSSGTCWPGRPLAGPAAELAGRLDPAFLTEAGWDPVSRVLSLPAEHPLLGRTVCRVGGCTSTAHGGPTGGVCWRCFTRLGAQGLTGPQIASLPELPPLPDRPAGCAVPGCQRMSPAPRSTLCAPHSSQFRRRPWASRRWSSSLADPRVRPLPALGPCQVAACTRRTESDHGYCPTHYQRWRTAVAADPDTDRRHWQADRSPRSPRAGR